MGKGSTAPAGPNPERVHDRSDLARELDLLRTRAALGTRKPRVSLAELAVRIGEPRSTVHAYVAGRHLPGSEVLDRIVIALGATAEEQRAWNEAWFRVAARREVSPSAAGHDEVVPHQLVPDVDTFTGRAAELAELDRRLDAAAGADPAQVISALAGTGGVGKSALAAHWAHRVAAAFPDGQLWVNLRGFDPDQPLSPDAALAALLHALGVADAEIPTDVEERAARYRSLVADRRLLVVLDNARDTEQVRLLLPGTPSCFVIVTSRDSLVGLVARHGAHRIDLDGLPEPDAIDLVDRLVGERAGREPAAARRLIRRCGRLPLALILLGLTTLVILFAMTGSVVLPLKALVMNVLGLSAAFGLLVLVFQDGRLESLLGYTSQGALEVTQPLVLLAIAFGLSTDYGVFLLTRVKEARDEGASNDEAVAIGLQRTGRIVTAAALLLCIAIGAFATSEIVFVKQVGIGTAAAVLIDATIVRALLVPSLMKLLGERNWWAPAPLRRLHARLGLGEGG